MLKGSRFPPVDEGCRHHAARNDERCKIPEAPASPGSGEVNQGCRRPNPVKALRLERQSPEIRTDEGQPRASTPRMGQEGPGQIQTHAVVTLPAQVPRILSRPAPQVEDPHTTGEKGEPFRDQRRRPIGLSGPMPEIRLVFPVIDYDSPRNVIPIFHTHGSFNPCVPGKGGVT